MKITYRIYEILWVDCSLFDKLLLTEDNFKTEQEAENYIKENAFKNRSYTIMKFYQND